MGSGTGKGYKNLAGSDPKIHSQSSKGIKQPERVCIISTPQPSSENLPFMEDVYGFDEMRDRVVRTTIDPEKFLRDTMEESNQTDMGQGKEPRYKQDFDKYIKEVLFENRIKGIKEVLEGKKKSQFRLPRPFIEYNNGIPYAHEGRHTMEAMRRMGIKNAPVTIVYHHEGKDFQN